MSVCILADAAHVDQAKQIELEYMTVEDLKKWVQCDAQEAIQVSDIALTAAIQLARL